MALRTIITMPRTARRGEIIEIRTTVAHAMESGYRVDANGRTLPRNILRRFECRYDGELVFAADLHPAIAANPFIAFHTVAVASGTLSFSWRGDEGVSHTENVALTVA
jgi:sulfur-oxidizing protein SoxZ